MDNLKTFGMRDDVSKLKTNKIFLNAQLKTPVSGWVKSNG